MDVFYASAEQRDNPDLRGKSIAVGRSEARGVLIFQKAATCFYKIPDNILPYNPFSSSIIAGRRL